MLVEELFLRISVFTDNNFLEYYNYILLDTLVSKNF